MSSGRDTASSTTDDQTPNRGLVHAAVIGAVGAVGAAACTGIFMVLVELIKVIGL